MLRTAGPEVYDQWVAHEIPFNDPAVLAAGETFGEVMFADGYVLGGAAATRRHRLRRRARCRCSSDPPGAGCTGRRASSTRSSPRTRRPASTTTGSRCPPIDQEGILYAGELTVVGTERQPSRGRRLPQPVHRRGRAVRDGRRAGVVPHLAERERRARTATPTTSWPTRRRSSPTALDGGHRALRRLRPHAGRGRERAASGPGWSSTCGVVRTPSRACSTTSRPAGPERRRPVIDDGSGRTDRPLPHPDPEAARDPDRTSTSADGRARSAP